MVWWLRVGMDVPLGLEPREEGPPIKNPGTYLSRGSQDQGSSGQRCEEGWLWVWGVYSQVSGTLLCRGRIWDVPLSA